MNSGLGVLIVGGYGTFGGRIVELLENEPRASVPLSDGVSPLRGQGYAEWKRQEARTWFDPLLT